jgi:hypothetical protein
MTKGDSFSNAQGNAHHGILTDADNFATFSKRFDANSDIIQGISRRVRSLDWLAQNRPDLYPVTLFTWSKRRRSETEADQTLLPRQGWSLLALIPVADHLRTHLGGSWDPMLHPTNWPGLLAEAIDEVVEILWLLRAGLTVPATVWSRVLLERWTLNVASSNNINIPTTGMTSAWISHVWQEYGAAGISPSVGAWWGTLSEIAHGRVTSGRLGATIVGALSILPSNNKEIHEGICKVLEVVLFQVRVGLMHITTDAGRPEYTTALSAIPPKAFDRPEPPNLIQAFMDLDYFVAHGAKAEGWLQQALDYHTQVLDPRYKITTQANRRLTLGAFIERRGRAISRSRVAFDNEQRILGEEFAPGDLAATLFRHRCYGELARLLTPALDGPEHIAMATAADALNGATHLWLEDSDYAMACVRVILEQTARLRAHRTKPSRAERLEDRDNASASRWLEAAGWRRLGILLRAVNEFSHLGYDSRREGARAALLSVQLNEPDPLRSRGKALDTVVLLFAFELHARLRLISEPAAQAFTRSITLISEHEHREQLERYLSNAEAVRDQSFGPRDVDA